MVNLEYSVINVIVSGDVAETALASIGGTIQSFKVDKISQVGDTVTYRFLIVHDETTDTVASYEVHRTTIDNSTTLVPDTTLFDTGAALLGVPQIIKVSEGHDSATYDIIVLNGVAA